MSIAARVVKWVLRLDMDISLLSQLGGACTDFLYQLFWYCEVIVDALVTRQLTKQ